MSWKRKGKEEKEHGEERKLEDVKEKWERGKKRRGGCKSNICILKFQDIVYILPVGQGEFIPITVYIILYRLALFI